MRFASRRPAGKAIATTAVLAILAGVPLGIAVLHEGFPVTDPDLRAREVWVTNAEDLLAGRLNRQIEELDAGVAVNSSEADVFQHGDDAFVYDPAAGSVERIDPSFATLIERIDVPPASKLAYGGDVLAVLSSKGELWRIPTGAELSFDWRGTEPLAQLGEGGAVAVSSEGTIFATAVDDGELLRFARDSAEAERTEVGKLADHDHELAAVGERAVLLDHATNTLRTGERTIELPAPGLRLQQSGGESDDVLVATSDALLAVPLDGGDVASYPAGGGAAAATAQAVAAPVRVGACAHAAWADGGRYLSVCDGEEPRGADIEQKTAGGRLEFRVNRDVVVLNNLANGDAWLVDSDLRLVDNWDEVTPPDESDDEDGDEKASVQTFEDTLADRTAQNHPPSAHDDQFGIRTGRSTIVDVLANDTDPDGDVLTIASTTEVPDAAGRLELIDGGRALQFVPAEGAAGTVSFRYSVDDGRDGVAEASANLRIVPVTENVAPAPARVGAVSIEQGQQISYNLLADWIDPDGDDVFLVDASPTGGDAVRASPDGFITFEHKSAELGVKEVVYTVSDGTATASGTFTVDVKPEGSLNPVGTPDFARVFPGESVVIEPLANDLSPSGAPLQLLGVKDVADGASAVANPDRGTITFSSAQPGDFVFLYDLAAGPTVSVGLVRVHVATAPDDAPPIAVKDTAYLRPGEPVTVPVLANDVSPSGRVLAVQSIDDSSTEGLVSVELLTNTVVRVSASEALDRQLQFTYTVSDGVGISTATVTVVPVPPLVKHQPPVALDDRAVVRAGDIVRVPVLANDYHPDAAKISLTSELDLSGATGALAFVDGDDVRFQAPNAAGVQTVVYTITDDFDQTATATITFTVVARDGKNQAPLPVPLTSRTFDSSAVKIEVPLDGIDPDGDSVVLTDFTATPSLGRIVERTSTSFTYQAFAGSTGTDSFEYEVQDTFGERARATIRIGVIPRPATQAPPKAVDDVIEMKPGRTVGIEVLLNDSDPSGYPLQVTKLPEVDKGIEAKITERRRVVVTAPRGEGAYTIRYQISNGHGGTDTAFVQIAVSEAAVIEPPTAEDQVIEPTQVAAGKTVVVRPLKDATNPGGLVDDLVVTVEGPNANRAEVTADGSIEVKPGGDRYAVAFRLTNDVDDLSAMAFVIVPPVPGGDDSPEPSEKPKTQDELDAEERAKFPAPRLRALDEIIVPMNGHIDWTVDDLVEVPSGQPATILGATATNSRSDPFEGPTKLKYEPEKDYRGPATLTFEVTDGTSADDPVGRKATLTIPITVGDPGFNDVAPTFTPRTETIEAGEEPIELELRESTDQPNPDNIEKVEYTNLAGETTEIDAEIVDGSTLRLSAPLGVQKGANARITFDLVFNEFTVPGYVDVKVVSSTRAKPRAVDDPGAGEIEMTRAESKKIDVLGNDFNPFAQDDVPLRIVAAEVEQAVGSAASVTFTPQDLTVRTGSAFTGTLSILYRVEDGTKDPDRQAQGRVTVVVRAAPDQPNAPTIVSVGDGSATVKWSAPANNNAPIDRYVLSWSGGGSGSKQFTGSDAGKNQTIPLANGQTFQFSVVAHNKMGDSTASPKSAAVSPWGTPNAPSSVSLTKGGTYAPTSLTASWPASTQDGGGGVYYMVSLNGGTAVKVTTTSKSWSSNGAGTYRVEVYAVNAGGNKSGKVASNTISLSDPPPPPPSVSLSQSGTVTCQSSGNWGCHYYRVDIANFPANGTFQLDTYCGGSSPLRTVTISTNGAGAGTFDGNQSGTGGHCANNGVRVVVHANGTTYSSNTQDWR
ncbi:fibronectin type III domain-containing protein [Agromyces protaetiae]|uniref:Fibronectin type III domain-containing protein n=1 Tax=Agromyces protaetiae TaxID=2509455 RepID=A0A4P6FCY3_9MICO|nr:Ig-like domain-containing protein [Agromyces protaetiae]QAY73764.1 fibronectin type III domain-containing protein [Agromyces protaetiae]